MNLIKFDAPKTKVENFCLWLIKVIKFLYQKHWAKIGKLLKSKNTIFLERVQNKKETLIPQLINPGFDDKIQVYHDPKAKETGGSALTGGLVGGKDKSYYFSKEIITTLVKKEV